MKIRSLFPFFAIVLLPIFAAQVLAQRTPAADAVLIKLSQKLTGANVLGYTYTRELNYASENYLSKNTSSAYLELRSLNGGLGFRYQFSDDAYISIFNGSESFIALKNKKTIQVLNNPTYRYFDGFSNFYNSPMTLRNALPQLIPNEKLVKKLTEGKLNGRLVYLIDISMPKLTISPLGNISEMQIDRTNIYRITVDAKTYLPVEVLMTNDKNQDFTKTTFANLKENPPAPIDPSWYFSSYTAEYRLDNPIEKKLLMQGQTPPAFSLADFKSRSEVSLEKYNGKVVLIEFWISQCGFCIAAVPKLNNLAKSFSGADFEFVSINPYDAEATIVSFKNRLKPEYVILHQGEKTADAYGVGAYPALVLIGKDGKIAYSSLGLFEEDLSKAIKAELAK